MLAPKKSKILFLKIGCKLTSIDPEKCRMSALSLSILSRYKLYLEETELYDQIEIV